MSTQRMRTFRGFIWMGLFAGLFAAAGICAAQSGGQPAGHFAEGQRLLAGADFPAALKAYQAAATADPGNTEYQQQAAILRQVIQLRENVKQETNPEKRETIRGALRAYYYEHRLYGEALPLDQDRHATRPSPESATLLAETLLELGRDVEAETVTATVSSQDAPPAARLLHGIALARLGRVDDARTLADAVALPEGASADVLLHGARLQSLVGRADACCSLLARTMQATAPSALPAVKEYARACPDFAAVVGASSFATALETGSKVSESKCSQAPSCGGCPRAKSCAHSTPANTGRTE
ncbi:MAG: hypothetical protein V1774_10385 [Candidatus Eisenbacteria bacterium]